VRVLGEVLEALALLGVARVADEAVGLGERAGPMNSGSTSMDRQSDTHAPHWMHAMDCVTSTIASRGTRYSRSGIGCFSSSHGVTRWIFFQWTASMSTMRSLMTGMLPIGSTSMTPPLDDFSALSEVGVARQAGLAVDAHAARAADRRAAGAADADRAVDAVLGLQDPVEHGAVGSRSTVCSSQ
jgi:hypothetical protein